MASQGSGSGSWYAWLSFAFLLAMAGTHPLLGLLAIPFWIWVTVKLAAWKRENCKPEPYNGPTLTPDSKR